MLNITLKKLIEIISSKKRAQIITIKTLTKPKTKDNVDLVKESTVNGVINFNYQNSVNLQLKRENKNFTFVSKERKWGEHIPGTPFIKHTKDGNEKYYIQIKVEKTNTPTYFLNGNIINESEAEKHLYKNITFNQGTDKPIIVRNYELNKIKQISINNEIYNIEEETNFQNKKENILI
jgi:hypothetical protein